jgi:hypothetical protein
VYVQVPGMRAAKSTLSVAAKQRSGRHQAEADRYECDNERARARACIAELYMENLEIFFSFTSPKNGLMSRLWFAFAKQSRRRISRSAREPCATDKRASVRDAPGRMTALADRPACSS